MKLKIFIISLLFISSFVQAQFKVFDKAPRMILEKEEAFDKNEMKRSSDKRETNIPIKKEQFNYTHIFVGKMWNAYSTQGSYTNQIFTDPYSNLIGVVYRGNRTNVHSGVIVYQLSEDNGMNWTPAIGPAGSIYFHGRHPNIALSNPSPSTYNGDVHISISYAGLVNSLFNYLIFVTDSVPAGQNYSIYLDSVYLPNDEMFINSNGWVFTVATLNGERIQQQDTVIMDLFFSTDGGFTWNKKPIAKKSDFQDGYFNGTKGFINIYGTGYIVIHAKKPDQNFYSFAYKKTTDNGATWDSVWHWVNPFEFPELNGKVHALNYQIDIVTDLLGNLNLVGTFVDTLTHGTDNNTGIYHIIGDGNLWRANLVRKVNVTHQVLPGGLVTLNECEISTSWFDRLLFIKWTDMPVSDTLYDLYGVYVTYGISGDYFYHDYPSTSTPAINEKFSKMSSIMSESYFGGPTSKIIYTIFGENDTNDLAESEIWFIQWLPLIFDYAEDEVFPPVKFELSQNYPNPFNSQTSLNYFVPFGYSGKVTIKVYNLIGEEISTLVDEVQTPGFHSVTFKGDNLPSGTYFFELTANKTKKIVKALMIK